MIPNVYTINSMTIHTIDLQFQGESQSIASYVIESAGGPIIVETGPHSTFPVLEKGLNQIGFSVEDVRHVFLSHIHLDHAGASWVFAEKGAKIHVHPFGLKHLQNPEKLLNSAKRIYQDQMDALWGTMKPIPAEQLIAAEDGDEFSIGGITLQALYTPGHAVHHHAWKLEDIVFSGDVGGVKIGDNMVIPPCPPPDINLEDWKKSIALLRSGNYRAIYLTHFGEHANPNDILDKLEERLEGWAQWIKPYFLNSTVAEEIVPAFQAFVGEELAAFGASEEDIKRYDKANPAWMSVYGLLRYWKKKLSS